MNCQLPNKELCTILLYHIFLKVTKLLISIEKKKYLSITKCSNWKESVTWAPAAGNSGLNRKCQMSESDEETTVLKDAKTHNQTSTSEKKEFTPLTYFWKACFPSLSFKTNWNLPFFHIIPLMKEIKSPLSFGNFLKIILVCSCSLLE